MLVGRSVPNNESEKARQSKNKVISSKEKLFININNFRNYFQNKTRTKIDVLQSKTICEKAFGFVNAQVMGTVMLNQNVGCCLINDAKCFSYIVKTTKDQNHQNMLLQ